MGNFLTPPGQTAIRGPRLDENSDWLGNFAGNDSGPFAKVAQLLVKLRQPVSVASLGMGGFPASGKRIFRPQDVSAIHADIDRGRRSMIQNQRIVSDEPIDNALNYGKTWEEVRPHYEELSRIQNGLYDRRPIPTDPRFFQKYDILNQQDNRISNLLNMLNATAERRTDAMNLTPPGTNAITERKFLEQFIQNAWEQSLGAKYPTQQTALPKIDLSAEQQHAVSGRDPNANISYPTR